MPDFDNLIYEKPETEIARIWLNRPEARNAQNTQLLYELNSAYDEAMNDHDVKVVILAAKGPHFSSGHDLREIPIGATEDRVGTWNGDDWEGSEAFYCREKEIYEGFCRRWRIDAGLALLLCDCWRRCDIPGQHHVHGHPGG